MKWRIACVFGCASMVAFAFDASAAPPWVERHLTLPARDWAFDVGLGVGHVRYFVEGPRFTPGLQSVDATEVGINAEMAVGVTDRVQIGLRTGFFRGSRTHADEFGRLYDRQTFAAGEDPGRSVANPELSVRGALVRAKVAELGLEGRVVAPIADPTDAGFLFGVPLAFHIGRRVRLDTGAYLPVVFRQSTTYVAVSLPLDVWIQASPRLWLGPMTGLFIQRPGDVGSQAYLSLGFGLGYEITHYLDFKAMVLFPTLSSDSRFFGFGAGVEIRIE